jgi:putative oxidoreductase
MNRDLGLLVLRLFIGVTMASHGYQKVFGGIMHQMIMGVEKLGFPAPVVFAWAAALSELLGGILVAIGLKTRVAAAFVVITMGVAVFMAHRADAFQVKELAVIYLGAFLAVALTGAGKYSLDRS